MAKAKKTRKAKIEKEPEVDEVEEEETEEESPVEETSNTVPVSTFGRKKAHGRGGKTFTALLMNGTTYEIFGMKFRRGVPQKVPMKYYDKFRTNGWFQLSNIGK
jgi:hypothetical protein